MKPIELAYIALTEVFQVFCRQKSSNNCFVLPESCIDKGLKMGLFLECMCCGGGWGYSDRFFAHFLSYRLYYFAQVY